MSVSTMGDPTEGKTSSRQRSLERVQRIVLAALAGYGAKIYLFGSCATGKAVRTSDIDVAIDPRGNPVPLGRRYPPRAGGKHHPYFVELVDLRDANQDFGERVLSEVVAWN